MHRYRRFFVFFIMITLITPPSYAQEASGKKEEFEVSNKSVEKDFPSYTQSLKQLIKEAEKNIKKVNVELEGRKREEEARELHEEGNRLYKEGNFAEAKSKWQKALSIAQDPDMKDYIRLSERRAAEAEKRKKKERKEQKQLERQKRIELRQRQAEEKRQKKEAAKRERRKVKLRQEAIQRAEQKSAKVAASQKAKEKAVPETKPETKPGPRTKEAPEKESAAAPGVSKTYKEGVRLYDEKKYEEAYEKFKDVRKLQPGYARSSYYFHSCDYILKTRKPEDKSTPGSTSSMDIKEHQKLQSTIEKNRLKEAARQKKAAKKAQRDAENKKRLAEKKARLQKEKEQRVLKLAEQKKQKALERQKQLEKKKAAAAEKKARLKKRKQEKKPQATPEKKVSPAASKGSIAPLYKEGVKLYDDKKYAEAFEIFKKVREMDPSYERISYYYHSSDYLVRNLEKKSK